MRLFKKQIKIKGTGNTILSEPGKENSFNVRSPVKIIGNNNLISVAKKNNLYKMEIIIEGHNNKITLGEDCWGIGRIVVSASDTEIKIGDRCGFRGCDIALFENGSRLEFGDEAMAARDSRIYVSDFHSIINYETKEALNKGTHIVIGKHVWIGERAFILKNNTIADDVIIAAGSVVTKDLTESHAAYAGNPATIKKSNVSWDYRKYDEYTAANQKS